MTIHLPPRFDFRRTVFSHGWCSLPPFHVNPERTTLTRVIEIPGTDPFVADIRQDGTKLTIKVVPRRKPTAQQAGMIISTIRSCLRLDENFDSFYSEMRRHREYRWVARMYGGRLLRAPTVFEDVVKMICTTNCSWALTTSMVQNLCTFLGRPAGDGLQTFPAPEDIAGAGELYLREKIRSGYRSPHLVAFARRVVQGEIHPETWRRSDLPTDKLFDEVRSVPGVGPYAAGNILKLLGRYDYLGIDSWCRKQFSQLHGNGRKISDARIERFYRQFGEWRGLVFWMDVTRDWFRGKLPF